MNFSVVLIAKNEARTLPRLLDSLKEFRDLGGEVILVDTGSVDDTVKVAQESGCRVTEAGERFITTIDEDLANKINEKFVVGGEEPIVKKGERLFDYAAARNYAATLASNDMVAMPDCDEIYTKLNLKRLSDLIAAGTEQFEYNFVFSHDAEGAELIKFLHSKFYDRRKLRWVGIIHEVLQKIPGDGPVKSEVLGEDVIKLEHFQNVETNRSGYLRGLALDCYLNPGNDRNAHYFGRELYYNKRYLSAIAQLERHIAMDAWPTEASSSMIFIGDCCMELNLPMDALSWYQEAFDKEPGRREPLMKIAEYYWRKGSKAHVAAYVTAALTIPASGFYANYQPYYENLPHELLYWALYDTDRRASKAHFEACIGYQPLNPKYLHDLQWFYPLPKVSIVVIASPGVDDQLKKCMDSIEELDYPKDKIETIIIQDIPVQGVAKRFNEGVAKASGEFIVCVTGAANFDRLAIITAVKILTDNSKGFGVFNSEVAEKMYRFFIIHNNLCNMLKGVILNEDPGIAYPETDLWEKMDALNQAINLKRAVVRRV